MRENNSITTVVSTPNQRRNMSSVQQPVSIMAKQIHWSCGTSAGPLAPRESLSVAAAAVLPWQHS